MKRLIAWLMAACCLIMVYPAYALEEMPLPDGPSVSAAGAVLLDVDTGRVLAAKNAHKQLPMASTTKVMTALLAIEKGNLQAICQVPPEAYGVEGSSMYLNAGEQVSLEDLLFGLMLASGNDAAVTIARHIGGSVEGFAALMNKRAKELGCLNTNFVTPNGLPDPNHYTTAYDLARISAEAMKQPEFQKIVASKYHQTATGDIKRTLKNKNKILWQYEGGNGVKTGFTKAAGRCLVFSAEREGHTIVGVVLNAPDMWNDAMRYLDHGFDRYQWKEFVKAGEGIRSVAVIKGMKNSLEAVAKDGILLPVAGADEKPELRVVCSPALQAPVMQGETIGMLEAWLDGRCLAKTSLIAADTVLRKEYPYYVWRLIRSW